MYKHLLICNILFIPYALGEVIPVSKVSDVLHNEINNSFKNTLNQTIIEGGSITANNTITLPKENHTLINIDKELTINKEKSVVPRKGVQYTPDEDIKKVENTLVASINVTKTNANTKDSSGALIGKALNRTTLPNAIEKAPLAKVLNKTTLPNATEKLNVTKVHKPLVLSHEALAKSDEMNHIHMEEDEPDVKVLAMKAGSHPGIIIPIVITILVVPMFAVVAYLALKRGKEAWRNRHYKRMDFLLDGMYND